jgi:TPR repeat protein
MRTLLAALTSLMVFATPLVAGDWEDGVAAYEAGNYGEAFRILLPLAQQQLDVDAMRLVGQMYHQGWGVRQNLRMAQVMYEGAAIRGQPDAAYNQGMLLLEM